VYLKDTEIELLDLLSKGFGYYRNSKPDRSKTVQHMLKMVNAMGVLAAAEKIETLPTKALEQGLREMVEAAERCKVENKRVRELAKQRELDIKRIAKLKAKPLKFDLNQAKEYVKNVEKLKKTEKDAL